MTRPGGSLRPAIRAGRRSILAGAVAAGLLPSLGAPAGAMAHAVVHPETAPAGAYQRYALRVPNERDLPTTRVEIAFPASIRVVSFADVPGWALEVRTDADGRVTGAVWIGRLPVRRFVEFPFVAVNPPSEARLTWPAVQVYADGERVEWSGPEGSPTPASVTFVRGPEPAPATVLASIAIVVSLVSLGLALRRRVPGDDPSPPG